MEFSLTGKCMAKDGKWGAEITLVTPDGQETTMSSGYIYDNEEDAKEAMNHTVDNLLNDFEAKGVSVVSDYRGAIN